MITKHEWKAFTYEKQKEEKELLGELKEKYEN